MDNLVIIWAYICPSSGRRLY